LQLPAQDRLALPRPAGCAAHRGLFDIPFGPHSRAPGRSFVFASNIRTGGHMNLESRLESLKTRHAILERSIADEDQRPLPDHEALSRLKRQKLRLKEEIERTRAGADA
jgi:hypothetical protein